MQYKIDAKNKKIGRVASEAARFLMGKNSASFERKSAPDVKVVVENASQIDVTVKKLRETEYATYSLYPGGLKHESMITVKTRYGMKEIVRRAVKGMLPDNKLKDKMLKNLTVTE